MSARSSSDVNSSSDQRQPPLPVLAVALLRAELASERQLREAMAAGAGKGLTLCQYLLKQGNIDSQRLSAAIATSFCLPWLDLDAFRLERCPPRLFELALLDKYQVLPLAVQGQALLLAVADPGCEAALRELQFHCGLRIEPVVVAGDRLARAVADFIRRYDLTRFSAGDTESLALELPHKAPEPPESTVAQEDEKPLVRFVNKLLLDAVEARASDIHLEPYEKTYRARFRIDGILHEASRPPLALAARIASRLKIMAQMDIAEKRLPQDGRIRLGLGGKRQLDIRISSLPTLWGEKLVLRLLNQSAPGLALESLGLGPEQQRQYLSCLRRQQGLILVTGPTGSGKTASLYAGLRVLNSTARNIATAEDPVEMPLEGINQVAVNARLGLGFPEILRAFLRQDPDVLMIGEIRDQQTADIAIKAAQTGHLVLSTLHTNSAAETVHRLLNMGIAGYNLASALKLVMAQRLLRRLCNRCKQPWQLPAEQLEKQGLASAGSAPVRLFRAVGCQSCRNGYRGRVAIYEVVPISPALSRLIIADPETADFADRIRELRIAGLRAAALARVRAGITSLEEANRLT